MTKNIRHDTVGALMHVQIEQKVERKQVARATGTNKDELVERGPYRRKEAKIGRNAPCPCGSGKKYKNCCGRFANQCVLGKTFLKRAPRWKSFAQ